MEEQENSEGFVVDGSRNSMQWPAMTAIYDILTYAAMGEAVDVEGIVSNLFDEPFENCDYFVKAAAIYSVKYYQEAVKAIESHMIRWTFQRRSRVEQAIYLLAYVHFYYIEPEVSKAIVISIALRLAKTFLDKDDYKFVNAVLDKTLVREKA